MEGLIEQLKFMRTQRNLKQSELGNKLGLPQSHISNIERGTVDPRLSTVQDMARMLDLELVLIPRQMVHAVQAMIHGEEEQERRFQPDESEDT